MFSLFFFVIQLICVFYMFVYALSPKRSMAGRLFAFTIIVVSFLIPYGGWLAIFWGAICWSDARAGN